MSRISSMNPATASLFASLFTSMAEEMGATLGRTAYSPNIKERKDYSCALFDGQGRLTAQAAHIPVHLGALPLCVKSVREAFPRMRRGDVIMLNDPFAGGTHLPDITLVSPWFSKGWKTPSFYLVTRAHHADVGGISPGSLPVASHIDEEGIRIPPTRLVSRGRLLETRLKPLLEASRTPIERRGDLRAQLAAHAVGARRLDEAAGRYGIQILSRESERLLAYGRKMMRSVIEAIPDGRYLFCDVLDDDGFGQEDLPVKVTLTIKGHRAKADFTGSAPACRGSLNAVRAVTCSAVYYVFLALMTEHFLRKGHAETPIFNQGCLDLIRIRTRKGSIVDAAWPRPVAGGNVETSQRITDVVLGALAQALPDWIPAASQGTMNNLALGGTDPRRGKPFAYYETTGGGAGAAPNAPGESAIQVHMTNTFNTPTEALEYAYPFRVLQHSIAPGTGGTGLHRGGNGIIRSIQLLAAAEGTLLTERRRHGPYGLQDGGPGRPGRNRIIGAEGITRPCPGKTQLDLAPGDIIEIRTPGGGGFGRGKKNH